MEKGNILNDYVKLIDKGYCCTCNELNCIDNFPHKKIASAICDLQLENAKLKGQLKKQKEINQKAIEYIKSNSDIYRTITGNEVGFFNYHDDGHVPVELLEILEDKEIIGSL